jgi:hypothetical protein
MTLRRLTLFVSLRLHLLVFGMRRRIERKLGAA